MKCLNCNSTKYKKKFQSYNGVNYVICKECGCHYQNSIGKLNYSESYWQGATDPDGIKRNFMEERDDKIKNWFRIKCEDGYKGWVNAFYGDMSPGKNKPTHAEYKRFLELSAI